MEDARHRPGGGRPRRQQVELGRRTPEIAAGDYDGIVIIGGSRILFDTNLDVWEEMTGRRPVQLAMPGVGGRPVLASFAADTGFNGMVVIDVTPEQFFREGGSNPAFEGVLDYWQDEGPARRTGHRIGEWLERHLAFLEDAYSLTTLIDEVDVPNRGEIRGPYLRPWKLSEGQADRQTVLWREIERNPRLRGHAIKVWLTGKPKPPDEALIARICKDVAESVAAIRSRGGDVVFIRPPSTGGYYEREAAQRSARTILGPPVARGGHLRHPLRGLPGHAGPRVAGALAPDARGRRALHARLRGRAT